MKKLGIIGHYGSNKTFLDGQTVKTKTLTKEFENQLGDVYKVDTYGGKKAYVKLFFKCFSALKKCKNVIILPAHNGLRVFVPLLTLFNKVFKRKLYYFVIGGWLVKYLENKKRLTKQLKRFDGIFVETNTMKKALDEIGFTNVKVIPNCKDLKILNEGELVYSTSKPYNLCTFSRVCKQKGIEDAVKSVIKANTYFGEIRYTLDIYGQVDQSEQEWFNSLEKDFPSFIRYKGTINFNDSVDVLKNYFALIFPTKFYTEGVPGTIIDAYASGIPVISSRWESYNDVISEDITGVGYDFNDQNGILELLKREDLAENLNALKINCIKYAEYYSVKNVVKNFIDEIG